MKGVKLEDVTGEKAPKPGPVRQPGAEGQVEVIGRPKTTEELMDEAAGQVAWAIVACFGVAALLLVNTIMATFFQGPLVAAILVVAALVEAACGWLIMQKRSRTAALVAIGVYGPVGVGALIMSLMGGGVLSAVMHGAALGAMANGVTGIFTYHRLAAEVDQKKMSDDHIKDVFGDGDKVAEENA